MLRRWRRCGSRRFRSCRRSQAAAVGTVEFVPSGICDPVNRQDIIARLPENEAALRAQGVVHAACSARARGDEGPDSDTDIMVEIDPEAPVTGYDYGAL